MVTRHVVPNPYETLGLRPGAEPEVVDAAYRALMKKHHPDRRGGADDPGRAQQINAAYAAIRAGGIRIDETHGAAGWEVPVVEPAPPLRIGRNLAWTLLASVAIIAVAAAIATS